MRLLRALWRFLHGVLHALVGWLTIVLVFPHRTPQQQQQIVQRWAQKMLRVMGIPLVVEGEPPTQGPVLLVANHISWLDILVMHAARHCRFVSKSDVKHWPLVGTLATGGGTLYIERANRRDAMRVVHHMADSLRRGEIVAVFPEGTTGDGSTLLPFHANLMQAAISADAPVQPVALRFIDMETGEDSPGPRYVGEDTLVGTGWRMLAGKPFYARVRFGEPQKADGRDRREWAQALHGAVDELRSSGSPPARG